MNPSRSYRREAPSFGVHARRSLLPLKRPHRIRHTPRHRALHIPNELTRPFPSRPFPSPSSSSSSSSRNRSSSAYTRGSSMSSRYRGGEEPSASAGLLAGKKLVGRSSARRRRVG
jgi:hypothetical protein